VVFVRRSPALIKTESATSLDDSVVPDYIFYGFKDPRRDFFIGVSEVARPIVERPLVR
jgi:hypothetical protein